MGPDSNPLAWLPARDAAKFVAHAQTVILTVRQSQPLEGKASDVSRDRATGVCLGERRASQPANNAGPAEQNQQLCPLATRESARAAKPPPPRQCIFSRGLAALTGPRDAMHDGCSLRLRAAPCRVGPLGFAPAAVFYKRPSKPSRSRQTSDGDHPDCSFFFRRSSPVQP